MLDSYTAGRPALKNGGAWQDSPFATGRRLVHGNRANPVDSLTLKVAYPDHQSLIAAMQTFDALLDKAQAYWLVDWQDEPVWIEATVHGETGLRYALIYGYEFNNYPSPYAEPYVNDNSRQVVLDGLVVSLERSFWQNQPPGTSERIAITGSGYDDGFAVWPADWQPQRRGIDRHTQIAIRLNGSIWVATINTTESAIVQPALHPLCGWR